MDIKVLQKDMIAAMKARDKARKESISALIQAVKNQVKHNRLHSLSVLPSGALLMCYL